MLLMKQCIAAQRSKARPPRRGINQSRSPTALKDPFPVLVVPIPEPGLPLQVHQLHVCPSDTLNEVYKKAHTELGMAPVDEFGLEIRGSCGLIHDTLLLEFTDCVTVEEAGIMPMDTLREATVTPHVPQSAKVLIIQHLGQLIPIACAEDLTWKRLKYFIEERRLPEPPFAYKIIWGFKFQGMDISVKDDEIVWQSPCNILPGDVVEMVQVGTERRNRQ